jgi:hypothetical protein
LFRRHIGNGANRSPGTSQKIGGIADGLAASTFIAVFQQLRQPEIQNLGGAAFGYENIPGLDVAVNNSFFVCVIQLVRQLNPDFDRPWNGKLFCREHLILIHDTPVSTGNLAENPVVRDELTVHDGV